MANTPECNVGDLIELHYTQRDSNANGRYEDSEADDPSSTQCYAANTQRDPVALQKRRLPLS